MTATERARTPYPPDPDPEATGAATDLHELVDVVAADRDWANARAHRLSVLRAELRQCRLTGSDLGESILVDVTFSDCRLDLVGLRHARLERVCFRDCLLDELDLAGAALTDVRFERCRLTGAVLAVASAQRVELAGCDLTGSTGLERLAGATLTFADALANAPALAQALGLAIIDDELA